MAAERSEENDRPPPGSRPDADSKPEPDDRPATPEKADTAAEKRDEPSEDGKAPESTKPAPKKRRWRRRLLIALGLFVVAIPLLWVAIHRIPGFGSFLANTGRAIVGNDAITWLEESAYAIEDTFNQWWRGDEKPQAYWNVPDESPVPTAPPENAGIEWQLPRFELANLEPMHQSFAAPGDGTWVPIVDERRPEDPPRLLKTLLHPDANRSWSAVAIVAVDLRTVDIQLVAGKHEPQSNTDEGKAYQRRALVPEDEIEILLAAFNGGYKFTHGKFGMRVDGVTLVEPKSSSCVVHFSDEGELRIAPWSKVKDIPAPWWRQTPPCMYDEGELHVGLTVRDNKDWGATIDGNTVIRRSAIALAPDGKVLYVGIGDHTTAPAIAEAMRHTGAHTVAQLDVNWSYPKFVTYAIGDEGKLVAKALVEGFEYTEDEYIRQKAPRDFFYLTRKPEDAIKAELEALSGSSSSETP